MEELTFQSGPFKVVGDLRLPDGEGPFPVVLFVHGDGPADRTGLLGFVFTNHGAHAAIGLRHLRLGQTRRRGIHPQAQRGRSESAHKHAQILLDAIELMKSRPEIDPTRIGVWGISRQAT